MTATLFSLDEARAFDAGQLASAADYPDAVITAAEARIRAWLQDVCGVAFVTAAETDERHDGTGSERLLLDWPLVQQVSAAAIDGVALSASEIDPNDYTCGLAVYNSGLLVRRAGVWTAGSQNVTVSYAHGYASVPDEAKRAALMIAVTEIPARTLGYSADRYEVAGDTYIWAPGDGYGGRWSRIPEVRRAIMLYSRRAAVW